MLTPQQIKEVVSLQNQAQGVQSIIDHIVDLIKQLSESPCTLNISFNMHNEDQHEKNEAENMTTMGGIQAYMIPQETEAAWIQMIGRNPFKKKQTPCRNKLLFDVTESSGIRILNAVLQEKKELQQLLQQKIETILIRTMKIELTEHITNPIQHLHNENHS